MTTEHSEEDGLLNTYRLHRARIVEEDALINHRMGWMLWSTSILLTLWGALIAASFVNQGEMNDLFRPLLAIMGFVVSLMGAYLAHVSGISVNAAKVEVERIRNSYGTIVSGKAVNHEILKTVTGNYTSVSNTHLDGHRSARVMPILFIVLWLILGLCSIINFLIDYRR